MKKNNEKNNEKKINWKNVAIIGGVFVLGVAAGSLGENVAIRKLIESETILLDVKKCKLWGKEGIEFVMHCPKAGIEIPLQVTTELAKDHAESLLGVLDGKVEFCQLIAN